MAVRFARSRSGIRGHRRAGARGLLASTFFLAVGLSPRPIIANLIIGGVIAAPFAAIATKHIPDKVLMLLVGCVSAQSSWQSPSVWWTEGFGQMGKSGVLSFSMGWPLRMRLATMLLCHLIEFLS